MMKGLNQFVKFDLDGFLLGKTLKVIGCRPWADFESKAIVGTCVDCIIDSDATIYRPGKDGKAISNAWEKLTIKVPKTVSVPAGVYVSPLNAVGSIYGEYRNQLSVKSTDIQVVNNEI